VVLAPAARYAIRTDRWKFGESQLAQPCEKGTSPYRGAPVGTDRWGLRHATPLPPALCDRLRIDELYDLSVDPREVKNVAPKYPDVVEQMRRLLHAVADQKPQTETIALSPAEKQRLTSLGYRSDEGSGQGDGP